MRDTLIRSLVPVVLALVAGGLLLVVLGDDPFTFYANIWQYGVQQGAWQDSAMLAAPLLLIAVGLIVVFRANIWNLGYDGQYLLGAALITGVAPHLEGVPNCRRPRCDPVRASRWPRGRPGRSSRRVLKARYQTNEIITTLMMSFIGIGLANILVKGPFQDPTVNIPQTRVIPLDQMLPSIPGTRIHVGVLVALGVALVAYYVLTRTSFGLRLHVLGANPRAAAHVGHRRAPADHPRVPDQRRADRRRGGGRHPRRVGVRARELEPGLRRHGDPVRVPRAAEPARGDPVHLLLRGALDRR